MNAESIVTVVNDCVREMSPNTRQALDTYGIQRKGTDYDQITTVACRTLALYS